MGKGRKAIPTRLKLLAGNPGKRPLPKDEPQPDAIPTRRAPPDWLDAEAKQFWFRVVPELKRLGLATVLDEPALCMLCQEIAAYSRYNVFLRKVRQNGKGEDTVVNRFGVIRPHPYFSMRSKSAETAKGYLTEFGMTPASRTKLHALASAGADDPLDELLRNRPE